MEKERFCDITLTTNTPDAAHIYEKLGFQYIFSGELKQQKKNT